MKKAIYIGNFIFPDGNAAGKRVLGNVKMLKELGYDVSLIGFSNNTIVEYEKNIIEAFSVYEINYPKNIEWFYYNQTFKLIKKIINENGLLKDLKLVILYGSMSLSIINNKLIKYFRKMGITVISDVVDWLSSKTNNPIFNTIKNLDNYYMKNKINKKVDGLIVISNYLNDFYKSTGLPIVKIPPITNVKETKFNNLNNENNLKLVYAGNIFNKNKTKIKVSSLKDRIDIVVEALNLLKQDNVDFRFDIYGFTESEYLKAIPQHRYIVSLLTNNIIFHGKLENKKVIENIEKADFSILIRENNRASNAGFPTKISESISLGTPVITTDTSDITEYIKHETHGYIVKFGVKPLYDQLSHISKLNADEKINMKNNCISSYMFTSKQNIEKLNAFINEFKK